MSIESVRTQEIKKLIESLDRSIQKRLILRKLTKADCKLLWKHFGGDIRYTQQARCFSCDLARFYGDYVSDTDEDE